MIIKNSVVVLVFNDAGELALQLRALHDDSYPLHWDFSAAGGIEPGETTDQAAHRELKEEIGIESALSYIGDYVYQDEVCQDHLYIYKAIHNGPFHRDPHEVAKVQFFPMAMISIMLTRGEKFHPEFSVLWYKKVLLTDFLPPTS